MRVAFDIIIRRKIKKEAKQLIIRQNYLKELQLHGLYLDLEQCDYFEN